MVVLGAAWHERQKVSSVTLAYVVAGGAVAFSFFIWCLFAAHGLLGNLLVFIGGGLFSTGLLGAALVSGLWYISEAAPPTAASHNTTPSSNTINSQPQSEDASEAHGAPTQPDSDLDPVRKQQLRNSVVQELLHASKTKGPPHSISQHGEYSGWVWTIPASRYDTSEPLPSWPPLTEGSGAGAMKWFGALKAGRLFLARQTTLEHSDVVPVVEIPLSGCTVRLVTEGLSGKTKWWRKTPLEVSHPSKALLAKQNNFYLFCDGSAAKEQWCTALTWASTSGGAPKTVQDMYEAFCATLRDNKRFTFPQAGGTLESQTNKDTGKDGNPTAKVGQDKKRSLFGRAWGSSKDKSTGIRQVKASKSKSRLGDCTAPLAHKTAAFLNPEDLDRQWMEAPRPAKSKSETGKGKPAEAAKGKPAEGSKGKAGEAGKGKQQLHKQISLEGAKSSASAASSSHEGLVDHTLDPLDDAAAAGAKARAVPGSSSSATQSSERSGSPARPGHDPAGPSEGDEVGVEGRSDSEASLDSPKSPAKTILDSAGSFGNAEPGSAYTVAIEHAINMLLARVAFDLLRSPRFKAYVMAYVQKKLDDLKVPDYINALQVVDVTFGSGVPHISNLQALASSSPAMWPQAFFDLDFTGDVKLVLEAKVDVRDGLAWSSLDKYIKNLEGSGSAPSASSSLHDSEAAAAATAVAGAADSDEEVDPDTAGAGQQAGPQSAPSSDPTVKMSRVSQFLGKLQLRKRVAGGIRQLAEQTAQSISKMQLRLSMDIKALRGPLVVWVPPPPGDRLWFSFLEPPQLQVTASPLVAGRMVKYSYYIARISSFIASKMQSSMSKNMVFPSCGDIKILQLLALDDEAVASLIPGLTAELPLAPAAGPTAAADGGVQGTKGARQAGPASVSGATVLATPTPPTAASALAAALKAQADAPPAPPQRNPSSPTPAPTQPALGMEAGATMQEAGHQAPPPDKVAVGRSGAVRATGADPNDPALHGMSEGASEASGKYSSRGASPKAGSLPSRVGSPRGTSFPSSSSSLVSSPQAKQQPLQEEDLFTRVVKPAKDKKDGKRENTEAEGLELGTMKSSGSIGLADDSMAHELLSVSQSSSSAAQQSTASGIDAPFASSGASSSAAQQSTASGIDAPFASSGAQTQPVSFQSLARLASQASRHKLDANPASTDNADAIITGQRPEVIDKAQNNPFHPGQSFSSSSEQQPDQSAAVTSASDAATSNQDALPRIHSDLQDPTSSSQYSSLSDNRQAAAAPAAAGPNLTKSGSADQKKWAYPVPIGSPMFERVRSRNYDQQAAAPSGLQQVVQAGAGEPAQGSPAAVEHVGSGQDRSVGRPMQEPPLSPDAAQAATTLSAVTHDSAETAPPLQQLSQEDAQAGSEQAAAGASRGVPRRSVSHGDASGYTASPKSWFQQQMQSNPALANKWDAKREDVQQRGKKFASNMMSTFTRAEERWRQAREQSKDPTSK